MPSANGVYSLPSGYLAVTGTTIQASQHNPPLEDIAAALTLRLSRDGTAPMTGALKSVAGTVGAPGYTFQTDGTTGFYKTTSGIGVAVAGTKVAEFLPGGIVGGKFVGELFHWTGSSAPGLSVLPFGQTLSRTTYADLWTLAQVEIAAGNTFYNNGDGSTTFGVGDCRGRAFATLDEFSGGSAASRLTSTYFGADATKIGAVGGLESHTLTTAELPAHNHTITDPGHTHSYTVHNTNVQSGNTISVLDTVPGAVSATSGSATTGITINNAGSGNPHNICQPTMVLSCALFAGA